MMHTCIRCKQSKETTNFRKTMRGTLGIQNVCKQCISEKIKATRERRNNNTKYAGNYGNAMRKA